MEERRNGYKDLEDKIDVIVSNQVIIKNYIENQFGGVDLAGNPVEGNVTKQLRELSDKVKTQNGRVGKLENWRSYILGALALMGVGLPFLVVLLERFTK